MATRYKTLNNWSPYRPSGMALGLRHDVVLEECDLLDTRGNVTYEGGAIRVKAPGQRAKTFTGETAWMDAERHASDLSHMLDRQERDW